MIKLALPAGKANPAPPVGPALGAKVRPCRLAPPLPLLASAAASAQCPAAERLCAKPIHSVCGLASTTRSLLLHSGEQRHSPRHGCRRLVCTAMLCCQQADPLRSCFRAMCRV